jgi:hypothetical protein
MQAMMHEHLNLTGAEAQARKTGDCTADVTAFENVHIQILAMADMPTEGIVMQFSNMFRECDEKNHKKPSLTNMVVLNQNRPNPFNDETVISYFIPDHIEYAQIIIYDNMGMIVV